MAASLPLVAVVTPAYNGARYLDETMACVQAQTYPNLVHVVLDNASSDATPEIINRYANARVPVKTARNPETVPLAQNWERAVKLALPEAQWIRLLCADDKITPDCIEKTVAIGIANPNVSIIGCGFSVMDKPQPSLWPPGGVVLPGREAARRIFMGEGELIGPHLMWRADAMLKREPFYDADYLGIDTEAGLFLMQQGDWGCTTEILAWTRVHEETVSHNVMHARGSHFLDWARYIHRYGPWAMDEAQLAAHKRAFRRYHLRRLMRWRTAPGGKEKVGAHLKLLTELNSAPDLADYADALADVVFKRLKLRAPVSAGFPLG